MHRIKGSHRIKHSLFTSNYINNISELNYSSYDIIVEENQEIANELQSWFPRWGYTVAILLQNNSKITGWFHYFVCWSVCINPQIWTFHEKESFSRKALSRRLRLALNLWKKNCAFTFVFINNLVIRFNDYRQNAFISSQNVFIEFFFSFEIPFLNPNT